MLLEPHRCSIDAVAGRPGLAELAARSNGADVRTRGVQVRYRPGGPLALDGLDLDLPVRRSALTADLLTVTAGRATLLITHEPDGLDQVDEIIVLDRGRVAQRGMHRELAAADGPYRRLQRSRTARASR
jgi:hypothetical protein